VAPLGDGILPTSALLSNPTLNVRGFEAGGIAPRQVGDESVRGGTTAFGASIALRYKVLNHPTLPIYASAYIDAGTVFDQGSDFTFDSNGTAVAVQDSDSLRVSSGFGIILQSGAGAITLTLSNVEKSEPFDQPEDFQFSFGQNL